MASGWARVTGWPGVAAAGAIVVLVGWVASPAGSRRGRGRRRDGRPGWWRRRAARPRDPRRPRLDRQNLDLLRALPVSGVQVVRGELLGAAAPAVALQWALLPVAAVGLRSAATASDVLWITPPPPSSGPRSCSFTSCCRARWWCSCRAGCRGRASAGGPEAIGLRLVVAIGGLVALSLLLVPAVVAGVVALLAAWAVVGPGSTSAVALAAVLAASVLVAEAWLATRLLGTAFDRLESVGGVALPVQPLRLHVLPHLPRHEPGDVLAARNPLAHLGRRDPRQRGHPGTGGYPSRPTTTMRASSWTRSHRHHLSVSGRMSAPTTSAKRWSGCFATRCSRVRAVFPTSGSSRSSASAEQTRDAAHVARRELAHADAIVERRERLPEGVAVRREEPDLRDVLRRERPVRRHEVRDVRRVEGAAEERDRASHLQRTDIFVAPPSGARSTPQLGAVSSPNTVSVSSAGPRRRSRTWPARRPGAGAAGARRDEDARANRDHARPRARCRGRGAVALPMSSRSSSPLSWTRQQMRPSTRSSCFGGTTPLACSAQARLATFTIRPSSGSGGGRPPGARARSRRPRGTRRRWSARAGPA